MKICIINPGVGKTYQELTNTLSAIEPPIWCLMLSGFLQRKNPEIETVIHDCNIENVPFPFADSYAIYVAGHNPNASTQLMPEVIDICNKLRGHKIILLGNHPRALPELTMAQTGVQYISDREMFYYNKDFKISYADLDYLPILPWEKIQLLKYRAHNWHCFGKPERSYGTIYTSLGCPFHCPYCTVKGSYRLFNMDSVDRELATLYAAGINNIKIADELFLFSWDHVKAFCDRAKDYGFNFWCYGRADCIRVKHLKMLKDSGINWIALGIEGPKDPKSGKIKAMVKIIKEHGINIVGNYLVGTDDDPLDLAVELNCEWANFNPLMSFPGSNLWKDGQSTDWEQYCYYSERCNPVGGLQTILRRDDCFSMYFSNRQYLLMMKEKFGRGVEGEIKDMLKTKLKRADTQPKGE